jgi:hypothetical protein
MRYFRYNLSEQPRFNKLKLTILTILLGMISLLLIYGGVRLWSQNRRMLRDNVTRLEEIQDRIRELESTTTVYQEQINRQKEVWGERVQAVNSLIKQATRPLVISLTRLEEMLPSAVVIKELKYTGEADSLGFTIRVAAGELKDLLDFYGKLKALPSVTYFIRDEEILDRENAATVIIRFHNEE